MSEFDEIAGGRPGCLITAALELAADACPDMDLAAYRRRYAELAHRAAVHARLAVPQAVAAGPGGDPFQDGPADEEAVLAALNTFFFDGCGFRGNCTDYYDPRNSFLNVVLDRRLGIPISLGVVYRLLARAAGVRLEGVNLPGHFLLMLDRPGRPRRYVDVFGRGRLLDWPQAAALAGLAGAVGGRPGLVEEQFAPMTDRQILVRMLRNLKGIYCRQDLGRAAAVQRRVVRLAPGDPAELSELAELLLAAGRPWEAYDAHQALVRACPAAAQTEPVVLQGRRIGREAALVN